MSNRIISNKVLLLTLLTPLLVVGCSNSQSYREADGGDAYLNTPKLEPLVQPDGLKLPKQVYDYGLYDIRTTGDVGKQVDVRPPLLPAPTIDNSYATYSKRVVTANLPLGTQFWSSIPSTLESQNIPIVSYTKDTIQTGEAKIERAVQEQAVEASFVIKRSYSSNREQITIELISLTQMGKVIYDPIEVQYYVVNLFNQLMIAIAPAPTPAPKTVAPSKDADKKEKPVANKSDENNSSDTSIDDIIDKSGSSSGEN